MIRIGPILYALPSDNSALWRFSIQLTVDAADVPGIKIRSADRGVKIGARTQAADFTADSSNKWVVLAWDVSVKRAAAERNVAYTVVGAGTKSLVIDQIAIPARGVLPRFASFSCNGFMHAKDGRRVEQPANMWRIMRLRHERGLGAVKPPDDPSGFHLLIGGGDQVYADENPTIIELDSMPRDKARAFKPSPAFEKAALTDYLDRYAQVYNVAEIAYMMARVPGVYTWDDHDIMDGWGSHGFEDTDGYRAIYRAARRAFDTFQLGAATPLVYHKGAGTGPDNDHCLQWLTFRERDRWLDVVLLDLRSHRRKNRVMSELQWKSLGLLLDDYADAAQAAGDSVMRHLVVVSSIPVIYLRYNVANWILEKLIPGVQGIEDDLRDQWEHPAHQGERARLLTNLLQHRKRANAQVTLISGDVHVAAVGRAVSKRTDHLRAIGGVIEPEAVIMQITTSAIVNVPPTAVEMRVMEGAGTQGKKQLSNGVFTELLDVDNDSGRLCARNFIAVGFDAPGPKDRGQMWIEWIAEDNTARQQITIAP